MVKLNKIYTRTGDHGTSGLVDGSRRPKDDLRFAAIGDVDEANAAIGMARVGLWGAPEGSAWATVDGMLARIQNEMFDLGADIATPVSVEWDPAFPPLRVTAGQVERLEGDLDLLNDGLAPLRSFVLPAGTAAATALHLARTIARRAERSIVSLSNAEDVTPEARSYANRLSDFLFVAARAVNHDRPGGEVTEVMWVPGGSR